MNVAARPEPLQFKELSDRTTYLHATQWVPRPLKEVFFFFSQPENLGRLTPPNMKFVLLNETPVHMKEGLELSYKIKAKGIPMGWTSQITNWDPPHSFSDIQLKGPYVSWDHTHKFSHEGSGTLVEDEVFYKAPGFRWTERLFIRPDIERIFRFRHQALEEILAGSDGSIA